MVEGAWRILTPVRATTRAFWPIWGWPRTGVGVGGAGVGGGGTGVGAAVGVGGRVAVAVGRGVQVGQGVGATVGRGAKRPQARLRAAKKTSGHKRPDVARFALMDDR